MSTRFDHALRYRRSPPRIVPPPYQHDADISLQELIQILWRGKWLILIVTVALGGAALAAALHMQKQYRASVVVAAVSSQASPTGASAFLSQFSGVAALAGIPLAGNDSREEAIAILSSSALSASYIRQHNLIPVLFAKDKNGRLPSLWQANAFFDNNVRKVTEDGRTGMITLTITWTDPVVAARWANELVATTNQYLRGKALEETERKIAYLQSQAAQTRIVQVQNAIYSLLESEIKSAMLARGTPEYALRVIDAAVPPERPSAPRPLLWMLAGLTTGFFGAALLVIARTAWRSPS
ncbi:MAG TPA: Wzz/FepE/Etk N-terminal domain-containing protein [Steroidobacteraceae bacterium]|nr:Wzz/FepE/Etk N-terminal domain-containing protein [Steroidobacteraceae bacterium]